MAFTVTVHVQTVVGLEYLATIANALTALGREPRSMSDMVATALEMLVDVLVENGYPAIVEPLLIEELLDGIGHSRRRRPVKSALKLPSTLTKVAPNAKVGPFGTVAQAQAKEIHKSGVYRQRGLAPSTKEKQMGLVPRRISVETDAVQSTDEIEVLPPVADEGEFSPEELRATREED